MAKTFLQVRFRFILLHNSFLLAIRQFQLGGNMERYATYLTLSFMFCFYFHLWFYFQFSYLLACTTAPACHPEAVGSAKRQQVVFKPIYDLTFIYMVPQTAHNIQLTLNYRFFVGFIVHK